MGMTIAEKIIARAAGVTAVKAGEIHTVRRRLHRRRCAILPEITA